MKLSVRRIGNSKGVILPQAVLEQLGEGDIELTLVGRTAVMSRSDGGELETKAALAYASVKAKRDGLFKRLVAHDQGDDEAAG